MSFNRLKKKRTIQKNRIKHKDMEQSVAAAGSLPKTFSISSASSAGKDQQPLYPLYCSPSVPLKTIQFFQPGSADQTSGVDVFFDNNRANEANHVLKSNNLVLSVEPLNSKKQQILFPMPIIKLILLYRGVTFKEYNSSSELDMQEKIYELVKSFYLDPLLQYVVSGQFFQAQEYIQWHYRFHLVNESDMQQGGEEKKKESLEKDVLYITKKAGEQILHYTIDTAEGLFIEDHVITQHDLCPIAKDDLYSIPRGNLRPIPKPSIPEGKLTVETLAPLRDKILRITRDRGHTLDQNNRWLLLLEGDVKDSSQRRFKNTTALRLAAGAIDCGGKDHPEQGMTEMLRDELMQMPDGKEIVIQQLKAQFPVDYKLQEDKKNKRDLAALDKVFNAITSSKVLESSSNVDLNNQEKYRLLIQDCEKALIEFRNYLAPGYVTTGIHFNGELLIKATEYLANNFKECDSNKKILFDTEVVAYIYRFLPAYDVQAFSQDLRKLGELKRTILPNYKRNHYSVSIRDFYATKALNLRRIFWNLEPMTYPNGPNFFPNGPQQRVQLFPPSSTADDQSSFFLGRSNGSVVFQSFQAGSSGASSVAGKGKKNYQQPPLYSLFYSPDVPLERIEFFQPASVDQTQVKSNQM